MRLLGAVLFVLLLPLTAAGQVAASTTPAVDVPTPPSIPPGDDVIVATHVGDRATIAGMLLDTDTSVRWLNRLTWWRETFRLHLEHDIESTAAVQHSHELELTLVQASYTRELEGLRTDLHDTVARYETELAQRRNPPFFETWGFAFGMGALAVAVVGGLIAGLVAGL